MFAYTGLSQDQCAILTDKFHIYCTKNGRSLLFVLTSALEVARAGWQREMLHL